MPIEFLQFWLRHLAAISDYFETKIEPFGLHEIVMYFTSVKLSNYLGNNKSKIQIN